MEQTIKKTLNAYIERFFMSELLISYSLSGRELITFLTFHNRDLILFAVRTYSRR